MSLIKTVKFWFSALIGVWVLIIAATLGQQRAVADPVIFDLQPPFQFVPAQSPLAPHQSGLVRGSTQAPAQEIWPAGQGTWHCPAMHAVPTPQTFPQPPQLRPSTSGVTQIPPQSTDPPEQDVLAAHPERVAMTVAIRNAFVRRPTEPPRCPQAGAGGLDRERPTIYLVRPSNKAPDTNEARRSVRKPLPLKHRARHPEA